MKYDYPPTPVTLTGEHVSLLPLDMQYLESLQDAVKDGELWKLWYTFVPTPEGMEAWIKKAVQEKNDGVSLPYEYRKRSQAAGNWNNMVCEKCPAIAVKY